MKIETNTFIGNYMDKYGKEPSYHEVVEHVTKALEEKLRVAVECLESMLNGECNRYVETQVLSTLKTIRGEK